MFFLITFRSYPFFFFKSVAFFSVCLILEADSAREIAHGTTGFSKPTGAKELNLESCVFWALYSLPDMGLLIIHESLREKCQMILDIAEDCTF